MVKRVLENALIFLFPVVLVTAILFYASNVFSAGFAWQITLGIVGLLFGSQIILRWEDSKRVKKQIREIKYELDRFNEEAEREHPKLFPFIKDFIKEQMEELIKLENEMDIWFAISRTRTQLQNKSERTLQPLREFTSPNNLDTMFLIIKELERMNNSIIINEDNYNEKMKLIKTLELPGPIIRPLYNQSNTINTEMENLKKNIPSKYDENFDMTSLHRKFSRWEENIENFLKKTSIIIENHDEILYINREINKINKNQESLQAKLDFLPIDLRETLEEQPLSTFQELLEQIDSNESLKDMKVKHIMGKLTDNFNINSFDDFDWIKNSSKIKEINMIINQLEIIIESLDSLKIYSIQDIKNRSVPKNLSEYCSLYLILKGYDVSSLNEEPEMVESPMFIIEGETLLQEDTFVRSRIKERLGYNTTVLRVPFKKDEYSIAESIQAMIKNYSLKKNDKTYEVYCDLFEEQIEEWVMELKGPLYEYFSDVDRLLDDWRRIFG